MLLKMPNLRRIGLFGGTFDPVHNGHLLIAFNAFEFLELDRIFFIPARISPFKLTAPITPPEKRVCLLRLALTGLSMCEIDLQEIKREGPSYTVDTVKSYRDRYPDAELFYLIGSDHLSQLNKWKNSYELARLVTFAVAIRPGVPLIKEIEPYRLIFMPNIEIGISASEIRNRIKTGLPIRHLIPWMVEERIKAENLYI
jgi:nicotinate-nucleotide adenylyltransferase